ncbi:hypothetical protein [Thermomonospora echinospora]|uniref:hypothetical protein n=1 Tax=Thermomonospora echinospora TaxID=1992 RepID=UPI0011B0DC51|nr:hypothetical protein [Thermomonospora echinospora]
MKQVQQIGPHHAWAVGTQQEDRPGRTTLAEIRRLLDVLLPAPRPDRNQRQHALNWSRWRRRQATARRRHYQRRTSSGHDFLLEY